MTHLVGVDYKSRNCYDLIVEALGIDNKAPGNVLESPKEMMKLIRREMPNFKRIDGEDLQHLDIILHGSHVCVFVDDGISTGILHSIPPRSEFIPCTAEEASTGLIGKIIGVFEDPTFWRLK